MSAESKAAFARRLGIHKSNVTRAAQAGRLVLTERGLVDVEASLRRWHETKAGRTDVSDRHAQNRGAAIPEARRSEENATAGASDATAHATHAQPDLDFDGAVDHHDATVAEPGARARHKAVAMHFENSAIRLEMALRRGARYDLAAVKREGHGIGAMVRAAFERVIDQTAPRLAVMSDEFERRRLIDAELRRLRWQIKTELPRAMRRMRAAVVNGDSKSKVVARD